MSESESGAGWSDGAAAVEGEDTTQDADHPFRVAASGRYEPIDEIGRGSMGEVVVARDRRLGRDVALKRIADARDDDGLGRRLAREAWVTARLEHPSIVPVYDAGEGDDGRLFYTMRLIHGRSLSQAIAAAKQSVDRLGLLRQFLAACEAVAYAHQHGILHRDLKPANIMVGEFGETQVVDWGLAGFASARVEQAFSEEMPTWREPIGAVVGTPAYMSPEQARASGADARSDVWALGAILHELVLGERLVPDRTTTDVLARLREGEIDRARLRAVGVPSELRAIAEKATADDPASRYVDAGELSADLARYLDGRRVEAHAYTTLELARRLAIRLRVPVAASLGALLAGGVALAMTFRTITAERTRAVEAEVSTRAALDENRRTSAWAIARQAVSDIEDGALPEAEVLAAHALLQGESADARGVLAAAAANPRPVHAEAIELPGCDRVAPGTWDLALCHGENKIELWELSPVRRRWSQSIVARQVRLVSAADGEPTVLASTGNASFTVLDGRNGSIRARHDVDISGGFLSSLVAVGGGDVVAATDGKILALISLGRDRAIHVERPCGLARIAALAPGGDRLAIVCDDGRIEILDAATGAAVTSLRVPIIAGLRPMSAALPPDHRALLVGGSQGLLVEVALPDGRAAAPRKVLEGPIVELEVLSHAGHVAALGESGAARVWDRAAGIELMRLPSAISETLRADPRGLLTGGRRAGRWSLSSKLSPRAVRFTDGLSSIAVSADGRLLAAALAYGHAAIVDRETGRSVADLALGSGVVKSVDLSTDGKRLAVAVADVGARPRVFSTETWTELAIESATSGARRLAFDDGGALIALHYRPPALSRWSSAGARVAIEGPEMFDLSWTKGRRDVLLLSVDGSVHAMRDGGLRLVGRFEGATSIAAFPGGERFATGHGTGVSVRDAAGNEIRWIPIASSHGTDLAVSPDERYVMSARSDGTILVCRVADGQLAATLRGHRQRVSHLAFAPDGRLLSAGWDGQVLTWDLSVLERSARELVDRAEAGWAIDLPLSLRPHAR